MKNTLRAAWSLVKRDALPVLVGVGPALLTFALQGVAADVNTVQHALCKIYTDYLSNRGLIFSIILVIIAWAGYMIYMGKREATDVIVKSVIATAIILGATELAKSLIGGQQCRTGQ